MKHEPWTDSPRDPKRMPPLFRPITTREALRPGTWPRRLLVGALVLAVLVAGGFLS